MYSEIMRTDPAYADRMRKQYGEKKKPQYVQDYVEWSSKWKGTGLPSRTKSSGMPEKKDSACTTGCTNFTRKGSNQYYSMMTCLDCGHGEKTKIVAQPTHTFDNCPHELLDHRGSSKTTRLFYCKQCCQHIDARSRAEAEAYDKTSTRLATASTGQQKLAAKLLEEQELSMEELSRCFDIFKEQLKTYSKGRGTVSSTEIKAVLEDAIDSVKDSHRRVPRPSMMMQAVGNGKTGSVCTDRGHLQRSRYLGMP